MHLFLYASYQSATVIFQFNEIQISSRDKHYNVDHTTCFEIDFVSENDSNRLINSMYVAIMLCYYESKIHSFASTTWLYGDSLWLFWNFQNIFLILSEQMGGKITFESWLVAEVAGLFGYYINKISLSH